VVGKFFYVFSIFFWTPKAKKDFSLKNRFITWEKRYTRHHVEVHDNDWWITKFESFGFRYSDYLTKQIRDKALKEIMTPFKPEHIGPNGKPYLGQHIEQHMNVFINPVVSALPEHAHLFAEHGCFKEMKEGAIIHRECGIGPDGGGKDKNNAESKLPESFYPLALTPEQDQAWLKQVNASIAAALAAAGK
jgi:hypothetical protein